MRHLAFVLLLGGCFFEPAKPGGGQVIPPAPVGIAQLAAGDRYACSIRPDKSLVCWGDDSHGELGAAGVPPAPRTIAGSDWTAVAASGNFACAISNGIPICWGFYRSAQYEPHPEPLPDQLTAVKLFGSDGEMCAIDGNGDVYCLGDMYDGGMDGMGGRGVHRLFNDWTKLSIGGTSQVWDSLALGYASSCAISTGGKAYCWGNDGQWELGVDPATQSARAIEEAIPIPNYTFKRAATGSGGSCGITDTDQLVCWGGGTFGDGNGLHVIDTHTWTGIAGGSAFVCGIRDTKVWCYGSTDVGALGDGFTAHATLTTSVYDDATEVVAGNAFACATNGSDVSCWGSNEYGEIGNGLTAVTTGPTMPVAFAGSPSLMHVTASVEHSCVLVNNMPFCWGGNHSNESVPGGAVTVPTPTAAIAMPLSSLTASETHTCGLSMTSNAVECWGVYDTIGASSGTTNEIGPPDANSLYSVAVADFSTCTGSSVSNLVQCFGELSSRATSVTGNLVAVGTGFVAAADGNTLSYAGEPCSNGSGSASVPGGQMVTAIAAGEYEAELGTGTHVCLIDASADIYCFGANQSHEVENSASMCVPPTTMHKITGPWSQVSVSADHTCALDMQGHLFCWGNNEDGTLGPGGNIDTPTQLGTDQWNEIAVGPFHTCGIKFTDAKLYCWGLNMYGEAGPGERFHEEPTPVQF